MTPAEGRQEEPYCVKCGNAAQDMLEILVDGQNGIVIYCTVCSKTTYLLKRKMHGKDNC